MLKSCAKCLHDTLEDGVGPCASCRRHSNYEPKKDLNQMLIERKGKIVCEINIGTEFHTTVSGDTIEDIVKKIKSLPKRGKVNGTA